MKSSIKNNLKMADLVKEESLHLIYRVSRHHVTSNLRKNIIYSSTRHRAHARALPLPLLFSGWPFPLAPLTFHAPKMASLTSWTPSSCRIDAKMVGPPSRIMAASLFITSREAPTYGARSICQNREHQRGIAEAWNMHAD